MRLSKLIFRAHFLVASMLVSAALPSTSTAQRLSGPTRSAGKAARPAPPESPRAIARLSQHGVGEIDQLKTDIEALRALLKEQQQAMSAMQKRLDDIQATRVNPAINASPATNSEAVDSPIKSAPDATMAASQFGPPAATPASAVAISERKGAEPNTAQLNAASTPNEQPSTFNLQPSTAPVQPSPATVRSKAQQQPKHGLLAGWGDDHAFIRNESGSFETDFNGYSQLD